MGMISKLQIFCEPHLQLVSSRIHDGLKLCDNDYRLLSPFENSYKSIRMLSAILNVSPQMSNQY